MAQVPQQPDAAQALADAQAAEAQAQTAVKEAEAAQAASATSAPSAATAAPPAPASTVTLAVAEPFYLHEFVSGVDGWDPITASGVAGPAVSADQVIAAGASIHVRIERR